MQVAVQTVDTREPVITRDLLLERAEALSPNLLQRASQTDADRRIPADTIRELREADLFRVEQPVEFGGLGMRSIDRMMISRTLARSCASTGWVHAVLSSHAGLIARFPAKAREEVWAGHQEALASSAYAPTGRVTAVEGGYMLDGRFPFSSGCDFAQWAIVGARSPQEAGAAKMVMVPLASLTIVDDWQTIGLCGTGSKTLQANDVFVPPHRVLPAVNIDVTTGPFSLCAVAVGMAEGAIERFIEHVSGRVSPVTGLSPADSEIIQSLVAESSAEVDAAWLLLERDVTHYLELVAAGKTPVDADKARLRRDQGYVGRLVSRAVDRLFAACGGSAIYNKSPLQRIFRDVHSATLHPAMNWEVAAPQAGRYLLKSEFVSLF